MAKKPTYSRAHPGQFLLLLDSETSGSTFEEYEETFRRFQGVSFGAIIANSSTFEPVAELYFEVKFDASKYEWSEGAEKIHGLSREHLEEHGLTNEEAAATLAEFLLEHFGTGKIMFAGHNPWFDIECMRQLLEPHGVMPDLHHVVLDTSGLGFVTIGKYRSNDIFSLFNGERAEKHNALDDARMTLTILRSVKQIFAHGAESLGIEL